MIFFSAMTQPLHEPPHASSRSWTRPSRAPGSAAFPGRSPLGARRGPPQAAVLVASVPLGGLPGGFFGASESPSRSIRLKRLTEERLTPKRLAVSLLGGTPRLTASTIFRLRSSE